MGLRFDPLEADYLANPYPTYAELRDTEPLLWHEQMQSWVISRYEDCVRVLADPVAFSADFRTIGEDTPDAMISIQTTDPPQQQVVREVLVSALHRQDVGQFRQATRSAVEACFSRLNTADNVDFVHDIAIPVTTAVAMALFTQDPNAEGDFAGNSAMIVGSMNSGLDPSLKDPGDRGRAALATMLDRWYETAADGYLAAVKQAATGREIDRNLLRNSLRVVLMAAVNSTQRYLSRALYTFLLLEGRIAEFQQLSSPERALHELVRFDGPFQAQSRACRADTELSGGLIPAGTIVIGLIGSANRDPRKFADPHQVIFDRQPNPHLGFGHGNHACFGAQLALVIGCETFTSLALAFPNACLAGEPATEPNPTLRGLLTLPLSVK